MYRAKRRRLYYKNPIDRHEVFEFWGWKCSICGIIIDKELHFPNIMAATLDHVIPLSRGGRHEWDNVRPAHAICNFKKGNEIPNGT